MTSSEGPVATDPVPPEFNVQSKSSPLFCVQQIKDGELKSSMKGATSLSQLVLKMKGPVQKLKSLVPHCACT